MAKITTAQIEEALQNLIDPISGEDVVSAQMVKGLQIRDGHVAFTLEVDPAKGSEMEPLRKQAEETVFALDGVLTATVVLTAEKKANRVGIHMIMTMVMITVIPLHKIKKQRLANPSEAQQAHLHLT